MQSMKVRAFLCDSVQSVDGKLYMLGAGWNRLTAGGFPARHDRIGIGVLVTLGANEGGEHNLELSLLSAKDLPMPLFADGTGAEQFAINVTIQTPVPGPEQGEVQVPLALNIDGITFPSADTYTFSLRLDGADTERLPFRVVAAAAGVAPEVSPGTSTGRGTSDPGYL